MFNELVESTLKKKNTNKSWTVIISTFVQAAILTVLVLIPLMRTEALPKTMLSILLVAPPPPPPPRPSAQPVKAVVKPGVRPIQSAILKQPSVIPKDVVMLTEPDAPPDLTDNATTNGIFSDIRGQDTIAGSNPAVPPPPKPPGPSRIKQGGVVTAASILVQAKPVYPALAVEAHVQGNVVLHAIIDKNGRVAQLDVISGHPLLVRAALDAAKQWLYKPTLLNGDPVEVDTMITVTFILGE